LKLFRHHSAGSWHKADSHQQLFHTLTVFVYVVKKIQQHLFFRSEAATRNNLIQHTQTNEQEKQDSQSRHLSHDFQWRIFWTDAAGAFFGAGNQAKGVLVLCEFHCHGSLFLGRRIVGWERAVQEVQKPNQPGKLV